MGRTPERDGHLGGKSGKGIVEPSRAREGGECRPGHHTKESNAKARARGVKRRVITRDTAGKGIVFSNSAGEK